MKRRVTSLLLVLAMLLSMLPAMAFAADETTTGHAITVSENTSFTTKQGAELVIKMTDLFTDSEGHSMTYALSGDNLGDHTKITEGKLYFTNPNTGDYTAKITAACASDATVTAEATLKITVEAGEKGDESQYGYDETPQDSVRVWVTISSDGVPIVGHDGTVLSHLEVNVPYFDLENQGLEEFYRYGTENGSGSYVNDKIIMRPTALHLYLYMIGVYYLGCTPEQVTTGEVKIFGHDGVGNGVDNMLGGTAYKDDKLALNLTGSATSMYMQQFWGHDENLMYYRNHVYPLMSAGWGSTADYVLLSDDDTIDLAMFSNWSFWSDGGAFACFDLDEYSAQPGKSIRFSTMKYDTKSVADGGTEQTEPITGLTVAVYDKDWTLVDTVEPTMADGSDYTYTFATEGTYYLLAMDPNAGTSDARKAPATAKVTVGGGEKPFDPAEYYKAFDFASITLNPEGTEYVYNIAESVVNVNGRMSQNQGEKKVYTVTIPADTEFVYVTYPADFEETIVSYCAFFNMEGEENWSISSSDFAVTENEDGTHTITLPAAFCMENDTCIALENSAYNYFNSFYFVTGDNTKPGGDTKIAVTGVTLDQDALTVNRGETAALTATVLPVNATNQKLTWQTGDRTIATVNNKGTVTGIDEGETTVIVTTQDGGYTAQCTVTVTDVNKPTVAEDGYYEIATAAQLKWFADEVNGGSAALNARLVRDIDLSGICSEISPWTPIGDHASNKDYRGTFDGGNHKITGLYLENKGTFNNGSSYYTGLFGLCDGATVKNLSVYGEAKAITRYVAGIVGRACGVSTHRTATIENCHNFVTLTGSPTNDQIYGHAGVVATAQDAVIRGCSNRADITGYEGYTGGIVAVASYGETTIENCWNTGNIHLRGWQSDFRGVGGIAGCLENTATVTNCYNTGNISFFYKTQRIAQAAGGIVGLVGDTSTSSSTNVTLTGCYSMGEISGEYDDKASMGALVGGIIGDNTTLAAEKCFYRDGAVKTSGAETTTVTVQGTAFTAENGLLAEALGDGYIDGCPAPVLKGQNAVAHSDSNSDGKCDTCGKVLVEIKVPRLIEGVSPTKEDTVQVGKAYLLSELQTGKVFEGPAGERIPYTQLYYQRSADGGETWGERMTFSESLFGGTTIQITELKAGTYLYRFTASTDGVHFSTDTWTLTLTVEKNPMMNFSFYVGKDYTGGYPIIKLYSVATDAAGNETLGEEITGCFRYSDFTATLPEGTEEYDPAQGTLVENYQMFYAPLRAGRYAYRAFAKNADTGEYDVALGGMIVDLPTDGNVDGNAGGGTSIYLQCNSFYVSSKKADNKSYFTAKDYHVRVDCPIMKTSCVMGDPYVKGNYTYYPTMLYAGGNACLYNSYAYPDIDGYIFTQAINQTFGAGYFAGTKNLTINTAVELTVTVPEKADFGLYFQWNNFNTTEVEPMDKTEDYDGWFHSDGTKKATYQISKSNGNYTWRLSDDTHVTEAGWLASQSKDAEMSFSFAENAPTDRLSHDFTKLGTQTMLRDEADLQINLDPTGYAAFDGTKRVRAYRHWQLINNDAGNIMIEPDFHWTVLADGDATVKTVNGGNTTANWADVTAGAKDSIITVYYDSIDVNPGNYGSHGGLFPATQPNRLGVIVVGGTGVQHGTADADVDFNMAAGVTTTRSLDWDYNYDTWFYGANETAPALDFAVRATGDVAVEYAFVTANAAMETVMQDYTTVTAGEDGRYTVSLADFRMLGAGKGGTVILKMTDETGVSYRLVRVAEVTVTAENVSNPKEDIMPGDQVKLTFRGMYRAVNKISGVFNPTTFKPTYYSGGTKFEGTLGQYQRMDNASITVTIPENIEFAEGSETAEVRFTDGYTYGSMYSAANPFAFLYAMTDTGTGTNFNAVTVNYYMNHYADAVVTVSRKVLFDTALRMTDEAGAALEGVAVTLTGPKGETVTAGENGRYSLGYGAYTYALIKDGYVITRGGFSLGSADAEKLQDGVLTLTLAAMPAAGANPWDGKTKTEPQKDDSGAYRIGTAAELAWYAASDGKTAAKLTADIELAGFDWTPLAKLYAAFDGQGHVIHNLYINSSSYPAGLFGYVKTGASVTKLGVTGDVTCTAKSNAQAGGIAGYMDSDTSITECFSKVNVTSKKHAGGIAGYVNASSVISDCYATGNIATISANECFLGGICASGYSYATGAALTNCYFTGTVTGSGGNASYVGGVSCNKTEASYTNCYYLAGTVSGESSKYGVTGKGTAKTADELKALAPTLGDKFTADRNGVNSGYPVLAWQLPIVLGDVNNDGKADNQDAALVYAYYNGRQAFSAQQLAAADVNGDGKVDNQDAALIYAYYNGKITAFPAASK
ncbi:MAG: Ig-like domain-containing protein [Clostridia bacterium]|nr:Ig-like domain-containing protein [Clostridia bacterium]